VTVAHGLTTDGRDVETAAVVCDAEREPLGITIERHGDVAGSRVFHDVGDSLAHDAIAHELDLARQ
jgi:hypothetical protein